MYMILLPGMQWKLHYEDSVHRSTTRLNVKKENIQNLKNVSDVFLFLQAYLTSTERVGNIQAYR